MLGYKAAGNSTNSGGTMDTAINVTGDVFRQLGVGRDTIARRLRAGLANPPITSAARRTPYAQLGTGDTEDDAQGCASGRGPDERQEQHKRQADLWRNGPAQRLVSSRGHSTVFLQAAATIVIVR